MYLPVDVAHGHWQKHPMIRYLIANWKMHGDRAAVTAYGAAIAQKMKTAPPTLHCVFCPPMVLLEAAQPKVKSGTSFSIGAQNCHQEPQGAFTGETSAAMLKDLGVRYVIIGHSERRAMGEDDATVMAKARSAIASQLTPVICIGEPREVYEAGGTASYLDKQISLLKSLDVEKYLLAYEPIWAIGSSQTPKMAEISAAHRHIKTVLGSRVPVLYGGSVNVGNIGEILALPEVSGALIGGASLEIERMVAMIDIACQLKG